MGYTSVERTFCQQTHMLKPPKSLLQITIYTHISRGIKLILLIERSYELGLNAFHRLLLEEGIFFFLLLLLRVHHNYASKNTIIATSRCSGLHAKQQEFTQHIVYQGFGNTEENVGCVLSVISPPLPQLFIWFFFY